MQKALGSASLRVDQFRDQLHDATIKHSSNVRKQQYLKICVNFNHVHSQNPDRILEIHTHFWKNSQDQLIAVS